MAGLMVLSGCHTVVPVKQSDPPASPARVSEPPLMEKKTNKETRPKHRVTEIADSATPSAKKVLLTGHRMAIVDKQVVRGSCWDYADAIYNKAGFFNTRKNRITVFKSKKHRGPYASAAMIQPGDWLYYINHAYRDIEHSAIFIRWVNKKKMQAKMLSYVGGNRREPAGYSTYDLSNVYQIIRAKP